MVIEPKSNMSPDEIAQKSFNGQKLTMNLVRVYGRLVANQLYISRTP